jgi:rubrerythrin
MSDTKNNQHLAEAFAQLSKAAARRKIYSRKAAKEGRPEVARFLRAVSASETVQTRRLFNSLIGKVDTSDTYLKTVFEKEIPAILQNYARLLESAPAERPALIHMLSQLRAAENRLRSFYSQESKDINVRKSARYFICRFCGYMGTDSPPEKCPICSASSDAFHEVC